MAGWLQLDSCLQQIAGVSLPSLCLPQHHHKSKIYSMQEVTVSRGEADEARAAAEAATPRMQATTRFGVSRQPPPFLTMASLWTA